jgi:hypothetical protein
MFRLAHLAAALVAVLGLAGCAGPAPKAPPADPLAGARCHDQPQWFTKLPDGRPAGVFVCFGPRNELLYAVRLLPPEAAAAPAPEKTPAKRRAGK